MLPRRTIKNCRLVNKYGNPGKENNGKCPGFARSYDDDEPPETCKNCKLHWLYDDGR